VRVTAAELAQIAERIRQAGIDQSEYLRWAALSARVEFSRTATADPMLIAELNRIGVNLNQMTRTANGAGRVPPELSRLCEKIEKLVLRAVEAENP
jgi:hypothetical protein